jgi:hypothetical protein
VEQVAQLLGTVHRRADQRRGELAREFDRREFFESLRLEPYYVFTAARVAAAAGFLQALVDSTRRVGDTLVHGDFSPKNILLCGPRIVLLDHEVIHWGDPAFDVGFFLTHLLSKAHHLPDNRPAFAAAARQFWQEYTQTLGPVEWYAGLEPRAVRHTLGCLLARVAGRSPLEYLDEPRRALQSAAAVSLMQHPPSTIDDLIDTFLARL